MTDDLHGPDPRREAAERWAHRRVPACVTAMPEFRNRNGHIDECSDDADAFMAGQLEGEQRGRVQGWKACHQQFKERSAVPAIPPSDWQWEEK